MRAFVFPGQMSEHDGMWPLVDQFAPRARQFRRRAEEAAGFSLGRSRPEVKTGGEGDFDDLAAQVAVLAVSAAWDDRLRECGFEPEALAGHSLGCYSALVAAGALEFEQAVRLAVRVQRLAEQLLAGFDGAMGVLVGHPPDRVAEICAGPAKGLAEVANVNTSRQVVISGRREGVEEVLRLLGPAALRAERLRTRIPFHSAWMQPVSERLLAEVEGGTFRPPARRLYSHLDGRPVEGAEAARLFLCTQFARPIRWADCVARMGEEGCDLFVEVGPGELLGRMIRWILRGARTLAVERDWARLAVAWSEAAGGPAATANGE